VKTSFRNKGEIKTFLEERKFREFTASRSALKELLKEVLQTEDKLYKKETWNIRNEVRATGMINTE